MQAPKAVVERVVCLIRMFDVAAEDEQQHLAAALASSSLPAAAFAAVERLTRAGHPQAHALVSCFFVAY